jgi:hypothetical protein
MPGGRAPGSIAAALTQGRARRADFLSAICACATSVGDMVIHDLVIEDYADVGLYGVKFFVMGK